MLRAKIHRGVLSAFWRLLVCLTTMAIPLSAFAETAVFKILTEDGSPIDDAVVEFVIPVDQQAGLVTPSRFNIDQVDKEFVPELTVLVAGSQVGFPNSDHILHHVYSFSEIREFNIPLYGTGENDDFVETFNVAGIAELGCNIHDWMLAYVYVAETSKVARTDAEGVARIEMEPGDYEVRIWHSRISRRQRNMLEAVRILETTGSEKEIVLNLTRDRRIRRAPSAGSTRYR